MVQYSAGVDETFAALADPTRRSILERLGQGSASISDLAESFEMTLTGIRKHVRVLEDAALVTTVKSGRVRTCSLAPRDISREAAWIARYQEMVESRLDRLGQFVENRKGTDHG
jgi:DNA-binding transcriptional ArsR family regulator